MNKRYTPIITFTLAVLLVGSIAYAADKRKKSRLAVHEPNEISEEALKDELLATVDEQQKKTPDVKAVHSNRNADDLSVASKGKGK
jgi:hypothetical protein